MNGQQFEALLQLVQRKNRFDQSNAWAEGSQTYLAALKQELIEVDEELQTDRQAYLEEEVGDVLWNYLNFLLCLDDEQKISVDRVLQRTINKFEERVGGIEAGEDWAEIKRRQKQRLLEELEKNRR